MLHSTVTPLSPANPLGLAGAHALFRSRETARRGGRILEDQFAARLADEHLSLRLGRLALSRLHRIVDQLQTAHCVRHRSIDELILHAVDDGFRQVVVLCAGYDMRPTRFAERIGAVRWYELDNAELISKKRMRLGRAAVRPYESAPLDVQEDSLGKALERTSFDPDWDSLFVLEGVIPTLTHERLAALFAECAQGRGRRRVVMSFVSPEAQSSSARLSFLTKIIDEEPRLLITPAHLSAVCGRHKLHRFGAWSHAQQVERFAPTAAGREVGPTQDVAQVERLP